MIELLREANDLIVLINCFIEGNTLTAGYFYCRGGLPAGNYKLLSDTKTVTIKLPDQAANLPAAGQQFNYPFEIIEVS